MVAIGRHPARAKLAVKEARVVADFALEPFDPTPCNQS